MVKDHHSWRYPLSTSVVRVVSTSVLITVVIFPFAATPLGSCSVQLVAWERSHRARWTAEASLLYGIIDCQCLKDQEQPNIIGVFWRFLRQAHLITLIVGFCNLLSFFLFFTAVCCKLLGNIAWMWFYVLIYIFSKRALSIFVNSGCAV